jgi:predicted RNase H-like HicB family nuclease
MPRFEVVAERDGEWFISRCPEVPGANGQGRTESECLESLAAAIALVLEDQDRLTSCEKLKLVGLLNRAETERQKEEIRGRYGDIPDEEMRLRLGALRLGRETMIKVFGWDPDVHGW